MPIQLTEEEEEENTRFTLTSSYYEEMKADKKYILSMQPELIIEEEL